MLMSSVLVPAALNVQYFSKGYRDNLVGLLRGVKTNGILITDSRKKFTKRLLEEIGTLPVKYRQKVEAFIVEILKQKNLVVCCPPEGQQDDEITQAISTFKRSKSDAIFANSELLQIVDNLDGCIDIDDYSVCDFEDTRAGFLSTNSFLDQLERDEVDDLFIRATKYSRWIRFYDSYIGQGEDSSHFRRFLRGVNYILELWDKHGLFSQHDGCEVEFITLPNHKTEYQDTNLLENVFMSPLKGRFPNWQIHMSIKDAGRSWKSFHARFLQSQTAILQLDRGFDFIEKDGFVPTNVKWARGELRHLQELRKFPETTP